MELDIAKIKYGFDFGSGNPNDKRTLEFLKQHLWDNHEFIRYNWATVKRLRSKEVNGN